MNRTWVRKIEGAVCVLLAGAGGARAESPEAMLEQARRLPPDVLQRRASEMNLNPENIPALGEPGPPPGGRGTATAAPAGPQEGPPANLPTPAAPTVQVMSDDADPADPRRRARPTSFRERLEQHSFTVRKPKKGN